MPLPAGPAIAKVKTYVVSKGPAILNSIDYVYDAAGRLSKLTYKNGNSKKCNYTANLITVESFTSAGISDGISNFILNNEGLAIKYFNNATPAVITNYTCSAAKKILTEMTKNDGEITDQLYHTYNAAGNNIADSIFAAKVHTSRKIDYYTDHISTTENPNFGIIFYGAANVNCPRQSSLKLSTSTYTHVDFDIPEKDSQGRIIKSVYNTQGSTYTALYTYY